MFTHPLLIQNLGSRVPSGSQFWIIGTFLVTFTTLLLCLGFFHASRLTDARSAGSTGLHRRP